MRTFEEIAGIERAKHNRTNDPNLVVLELRGGRPRPNINDMEMKLIIEELSKNTVITMLILAENSITDEGLQGIDNLKNIESLDLVDNYLGDVSLNYLTKMPKLHSLDLSGNHISCHGLNLIFEKGKQLKYLFLTDEEDNFKNFPSDKIPKDLNLCVNGVALQKVKVDVSPKIGTKIFVSEKIKILFEELKSSGMLCEMKDIEKEEVLVLVENSLGLAKNTL